MDINALETAWNQGPGTLELVDPPGYAHAGIAVIDAVWSIQLRYDRYVRPTVQRFVGDRGLDVGTDAASRPGFVEYGTAALFAELEGLTDGELVERFGSNHQASGRLKGVVVREVAQRLSAAGLDTRTDLVEPDDPGYDEQKQAWVGVHGLGGVTWSYFRLLAGCDAVKPDIMVTRWVADALGHERVSASDGAKALEDLAERLNERRRVVDHAVWRWQSGRHG